MRTATERAGATRVSNNMVTITKDDTPHSVVGKVNALLRDVLHVELSFCAAESLSEASFSLRPALASTGAARTKAAARGLPYSSFASRLVRGAVRASLLDAFIERWHNAGHVKDVKLHEYLGLTREEYLSWVETNDYMALKASVLGRASAVAAKNAAEGL